ncbi:MAG: bifunctional diaminohydroxyphosphoribosylaminopyrimidine deaminase/5-amino-6-(5-phosphoribosylamino)uracil reductase RibD [Candidatus Puniceispirillaceae bacterium]
MDASSQHLHERWMRLAIHHASLAEGLVAENPPVGCVLTDAQGRLVSTGHTQPGGRPHAEQAAIDSAAHTDRTARLSGGTAYVTLEPCAHTGKTAPCTQALISAGITQVFYAVTDPDPRVSGNGHKQLEAAGIKAIAGLNAGQAEQVMAGFLNRMRGSRPFISSKIATSSDGFISQTGDAPTQLTNETSRRYVHDLRSRADLLVTGIGTILADDPLLSVRVGGLKTPPRLILDSRLRIPSDSAILSSAANKAGRLMIAHGPEVDSQKKEVLKNLEVELIQTASNNGQIELDDLLYRLSSRQINHIMIEAGARLNASFLEAALIDRLVWLKAPHSLGSGLPAFASENKVVSKVDFQLPTAYIKTDSFWLEDDLAEIYSFD